jgi:hypothetical protein
VGTSSAAPPSAITAACSARRRVGASAVAIANAAIGAVTGFSRKAAPASAPIANERAGVAGRVVHASNTASASGVVAICSVLIALPSQLGSDTSARPVIAAAIPTAGENSRAPSAASAASPAAIQSCAAKRTAAGDSPPSAKAAA